MGPNAKSITDPLLPCAIYNTGDHRRGTLSHLGHRGPDVTAPFAVPFATPLLVILSRVSPTIYGLSTKVVLPPFVPNCAR